MIFDEELQQYAHEYNGIIFVWDQEPDADYQEDVQELAKAYHENLNKILDFIRPDLEEIYGQDFLQNLEEKLGQPTINPQLETVTYFEQAFDDSHIFQFEYGDAFNQLMYFSIDG